MLLVDLDYDFLNPSKQTWDLHSITVLSTPPCYTNNLEIDKSHCFDSLIVIYRSSKTPVDCKFYCTGVLATIQNKNFLGDSLE